MKTAVYSVLLWVAASILLSSCSLESNPPHALKLQHLQPPASAVLKVDYIDNDISLLSFDLNEEFNDIPVKIYSL